MNFRLCLLIGMFRYFNIRKKRKRYIPKLKRNLPDYATTQNPAFFVLHLQEPVLSIVEVEMFIGQRVFLNPANP
jgi:hypothetical protein